MFKPKVEFSVMNVFRNLITERIERCDGKGKGVVREVGKS